MGLPAQARALISGQVQQQTKGVHNMLGIGAYKQRMVSHDKALPGRDSPLPLTNRHYVKGGPLRGEFAGLEQVQFGLGCFWGAERKFWNIPGVVTTAVGYSGGYT